MIVQVKLDGGNWRVGFNSRTALAGLLVCAGYYLGSMIGFAFTFQPRPVSVLWPPNSILLAALLLSPTRVWWFLFLAAFPAHWFAQLQSQVPTTMILSWFISNCSEALIGAGLMRCMTDGPIRFDRLRSVGVFCLCGVFLGPFLSSFLDAALVRLNHWGQGGYWEIWRIRFSSNVVAAATVTPVIVAWATRGIASAHRSVPRPHLRTAVLYLGSLSVSFIVLYGLGPEEDPALLLAPLPFLLWAAVRFGPRETSTAMLAVAFVAVWGATHERGPLSAGSSEENALAIQTFVTVLSIPLMLLATVLKEREKAQERFAKAFRSSPDAMAITRLKDGQIVETNQRWEALLGYKREEAVGRTVFELNIYTSAEDREKITAGTSAGRILHNLELSLRTKSGELRQTLVSADTEDMGGELCLILIIRDVTERKRVEVALRESEERYRVVAETASDAIITIDEKCVIRFANRAAEKIFGYAVKELHGRELTMLIPDYVGQSHQASLEQSIRTGRRHHSWEAVELPGLHKDGRAIPLELSFAEFKNSGRRFFTGIIRDITERKRAQEILQESEDRYRNVVESQTELICRYLPDTTLTFVNEAYCRFFNRRRDELVGTKFLDLLPEKAREPALDHLKKLITTAQSASLEHEVALPDGTTGWQLWVDHPIRGRNGQIAEFQGIGQDITDRKRAEEANQKLAHASRLAVVGELTAMIGHEVNQPLGAILSNADAAEILLERKAPPLDEIRQILGHICKDSLRASEFIRHIRTLLRKHETEMESLDFSEIVSNVIQLVSGDALRRRVQIQTELAARLPRVRGDQVQLEQVLLNLILNGMDAMTDVPVALRRLTVRMSRNEDHCVEVTVTDAGIGIPPDKLPRVFESFVTTKKHGMGLGLSIARSIIQAHRGRIWVENNPKGGVSVHFTLPVAQEATGQGHCPMR